MKEFVSMSDGVISALVFHGTVQWLKSSWNRRSHPAVKVDTWTSSRAGEQKAIKRDADHNIL